MAAVVYGRVVLREPLPNLEGQREKSRDPGDAKLDDGRVEYGVYEDADESGAEDDEDMVPVSMSLEKKLMDCGSGARTGSVAQVGAKSMLESTCMGSRGSVPDWVDVPAGMWVDRSREFDMNMLLDSVGMEEEAFCGYCHCGCCCCGILSEKGCADGYVFTRIGLVVWESKSGIAELLSSNMLEISSSS